MSISPLKTEADHQAAHKKIETFRHAAADTPEGNCLDGLMMLVKAYEAAHYPFDLPDPAETIKFTMEQKGLGIPAERLIQLPENQSTPQVA